MKRISMILLLIILPIVFADELSFGTTANVTINNQTFTVFVEKNSYTYQCGQFLNASNAYDLKRLVEVKDFSTVNIVGAENISRDCKKITENMEVITRYYNDNLHYSLKFTECESNRSVCNAQVGEVGIVKSDKERCVNELNQAKTDFTVCESSKSQMVLKSQYDTDLLNRGLLGGVVGVLLGIAGYHFWVERREQKKSYKEDEKLSEKYKE